MAQRITLSRDELREVADAIKADIDNLEDDQHDGADHRERLTTLYHAHVKVRRALLDEAHAH